MTLSLSIGDLRSRRFDLFRTAPGEQQPEISLSLVQLFPSNGQESFHLGEIVGQNDLPLGVRLLQLLVPHRNFFVGLVHLLPGDQFLFEQ